ncbi:hypothetical protein NPIL_19641 [Nephila pilipes]|uniref:Uncharacterized protein n=1 Tax=Nephila pilipes TaxID=299642 RepID=A0A8X6PRI3_NEPPI|nr:hypothetical protein NPIL_19641 [Nephila pilipes]
MLTSKFRTLTTINKDKNSQSNEICKSASQLHRSIENEQILENVRQQPATTLPPPSQVRNNKKSKKYRRNLASPTLATKKSKKSKREANSEVSGNDSESMHPAPSSSGGERENEIGVKEATPLPTFGNKHQSGLEDEEGFTVVSRKQRIPPIFIDESLNTPDLLKELSETIGSKVLERFVNLKFFRKLLMSTELNRITSLSRN